MLPGGARWADAAPGTPGSLGLEEGLAMYFDPLAAIFMAIPLACLGVFVATVVGTTLTRGRTKRVLGSILAAEALT
ncbi:MAG: hypothetical protein LBC97_15735, partial [Bifidobacteriaceae bacterium]|nr:hypothetical protein [Bifidobacteriaceae bacterium]